MDNCQCEVTCESYHVNQNACQVAGLPSLVVGLNCGRREEKQAQIQATLTLCDLAHDIVVRQQGRYTTDCVLRGNTEYLYLSTRQAMAGLGHGGKGINYAYKIHNQTQPALNK